MTVHNVPLTSAEIGFLWNHYMANTMSHCMLTHFLDNVEDGTTRHIVEKADRMSLDIVDFVKDAFGREGIPVPVGFGEEDVQRNAPRLFSDTFYLMYLEMMIKLGAIFYALTLANASREDLRVFVADTSNRTIALANEITNALQAKGIYTRPPTISLSGTEFVQSESFFTGFLGEKRPLAGMEIAQLFSTHQLNAIKIPLCLGFAQAARSKEVKEYFMRGKDYNLKQRKDVSQALIREDIPLAVPSQFDITDSTESTYSDKLMMFHISQLSSAKVRNFGDSLALSPRHDLAALYAKLMAMTGKFAEEGVEIMIKNRWFEQPPHVPDRKALLTI